MSDGNISRTGLYMGQVTERMVSFRLALSSTTKTCTENNTMTMPKWRISVIGLGMVGMSLAVVNAKKGYDTIGTDIDADKVYRLRTGRTDFFEPGLDAMLNDSIRQKKIHFTTDPDYAIQNSEITFLTVGTPLKSGGDTVNLSYVKSAAERISLSLHNKESSHLLVIKSTVPPLTTENLILPIFNDLIKCERVDVVLNPEFLSAGFAIDNMLRPHLIVIGANSKRGSMILERYYLDFYETPPEIMHTDIPTAEIIKYANNAFLATKISFINSISSICQRIPGVDVNTVARAVGKYSDMNLSFLQAGPGFGGSCLPKDLKGLIRISEEMGIRPDLFEAVKSVNDVQLETIMRMVEEQRNLKDGSTIAVLGLAFKSGTDDIRESVSVSVVTKLLERKFKIKVHDQKALKNFEQIFGARILYASSVAECLRDSDCCILLTDWGAYKDLRPRDFRHMRAISIIDVRRVLNAKEFQGTDFRAIGLGR